MDTLDLTVYFNEKDTTLTENQVERIQQALMFLKDKIFLYRVDKAIGCWIKSSSGGNPQSNDVKIP